MKTSWRTSLVAIILIVIIVIGLIMVWFGKITMTDFGLLCGFLSVIATVLIGLLGKDAKASSLDKGVANKINKLYGTEKPE
jgi:hypothetical protein